MSIGRELEKLKESLVLSDRMPVVFLGHGSPMNAIEDTQYSRAWTELGKNLPRPQAILVVSAHWMTKSVTLVNVSAQPHTIHDFYGFPEPLYQEQYPAQGQPELAREVIALLNSHHSEEDEQWGLDHGSWAVLKFLYPEADVPVFQVSIDMNARFEEQLEIGRAISQLRDRGVLILGSGNIVHNLREMRSGIAPLDFAEEFDTLFAQNLTERDFGKLTDRDKLGSLFTAAHPTVDHYLPTLTVAGASDQRDELTFMTPTIDLGSVSMRSFIFHSA